MGKSVDEFVEVFSSEIRVGGAALLDELFDLALAIQEDLNELERKIPPTSQKGTDND